MRLEQIPTKESESSHEANVENIIEGRGLEEVDRIGWEAYREALTEISYSDIIKKQAEQIERISSSQSKSDKGAPEWVIHNQNTEAKVRAEKLSAWFTEEYGEKRSSSFFAFKDRDKKLVVRGRDVNLDEQKAEFLVTRIYFSVPTRNSPEAFKALFNTLTDEGIMGNVEVSLNLESYEAESLDKSFENNTIIIYSYGSKPELMQKIAKAIKRAKDEHPDLWELPPLDLAKAKEGIAKDFMIPLDDTISFVEASNLGSYHAGPRGRMFHEITGEMPTTKMSLDKLANKFKDWTPQQPGLFEQDSERRRCMPALVFSQ